MPKVRAFVDFLVQRLDFDASYMLAQCPLQARYAKPMAGPEGGPAPAAASHAAVPDDAAEALLAEAAAG